MRYNLHNLTKEMQLSVARAILQHPSTLLTKPRVMLHRQQMFEEIDTAQKRRSSSAVQYRYSDYVDQWLPFKLATWVGDLPDMDAIDAHASQVQKPIVVATNACIDAETASKWQGKLYQLDPAWAAIYYQPPAVDYTAQPDKEFACFINRLDPIRQSWFYQLIRRNMLKDGYVSFNLDNSRSEPTAASMTPIDAFEYFYNTHLQEFESEHQQCRNTVPYCNFADDNLDHVIIKSKYNIVLETYFGFNNMIMFTEKIMRSLRLPRPWLLYSAQNSVALLRRWGFDVLDDIIDHRYDAEPDPIVRQQMILDQCDRLKSVDISGFSDRLDFAAFANRELLERWALAFPHVVYQDVYRILDDFAKRNNLPTK